MLSMPFTEQQFFSVFAAYNDSVWPFQFGLALAAAAVAFLVWRRPASAGGMGLAFLALLWIWTGVAYHLLRFTRINPAAYLFGALFIVQGLMFAYAATRRGEAFAPRPAAFGVLGAIGIVYALIIYPLLGIALGHRYPNAPAFGAPCPSTIYTFALLLWTTRRLPLYLLGLPLVWALIGASAAFQWGMFEDIAMPVLAFAAIVMIAKRNKGMLRAGHVAITPTPTHA